MIWKVLLRSNPTGLASSRAPIAEESFSGVAVRISASHYASLSNARLYSEAVRGSLDANIEP
jgi:hypothetical protein